MKKTVEERIFEAIRIRLAYRIRYRNLLHGAAQSGQNQDTPRTDLFLKAVQCFRNMVRNLDADVLDKRFFRIISDNLPHDKGVALIQMAYTYEEIFDMCSNKPRPTRLRLSSRLDNVLMAIWNNGKYRETCRIVLDVMASYVEACREMRLSKFQRKVAG